MTTIVFRDGVLVADSQETIDTEAGGSRKFRCTKLFRRTAKDGTPFLIALAGESSSGMVFLDWYGSGKGKRRVPQILVDADAGFEALVYREGQLLYFDAWCRPTTIEEPFYAIGSGAKAALGALHMGATAEQACEIATRIDTYSSPPILVMRLDEVAK